MDEKSKHRDIDTLLTGIFSATSKTAFYPLKELFQQRLDYLKITRNQAVNILGLDPKTLTSILAGDSKKVDFLTILKLSDFLEIPQNEIINKYFQLINTTHNESLNTAKKRSFIVNNFNLPSLKKIGFIDSISDYEHIEKRINTFFGYHDVFEFGKHKINAVFSSGKRSTNKENLTFWYAAAIRSLEETPNPYEFDREALVEYFPQIRWHSMDVENGLFLVAQALFKLGITVIIVPKFTKDIHVRGATIPFKGKPCIVLTKYTKFYATMWFALIHELFHVLYDWEEIEHELYHISGETTSMKISEAEADSFARQYLFSDEKMNQVKPYINNSRFVKHFAEQNHVHPSIIYSFYNYDLGREGSYAKNDIYMPEFDSLLERFNAQEFLSFPPIKQISSKRNSKMFNTI